MAEDVWPAVREPLRMIVRSSCQARLLEWLHVGRAAPRWFETVYELSAGIEVLKRRAYGVIEVVEGRLWRIRLRPFPKIASVPGILLFGAWRHAHCPGDRCLLYYNQPRRFPQFLVLKYVVSHKHTQYRTLRCALEVLDEIARIKQSDALLCDVANWRVTPAMMARWGWVPHCPSVWHRHCIKRFYGQYPSRPKRESSRPSGV